MPEWAATLICPDDDFAGAPLLRREFTLDTGHGPVTTATLHATAHGVFEAYVNGNPVSDEVLSPGWSSYEWRLRYRSYDVTSLLQPTTVVGIALGNGWFRGRLAWAGGHIDDAYRLLLQQECPSWLYPVTMGATTIWERWDSMLPDGTINPGEMTSFNHYALGAVADWMHRVIGGIAPLEPGYARVLIAPQPGGGLTWARTSLETRHGLVSVAWRQGDEFTLDVGMPDQVTAVVRLPDGSEHEVSGGQHRLSANVS